MTDTTNYDLANEALYPKAFLERKSYKLFITIPHTDLTVSEAIEEFKAYNQITYCKVAQEHHEDGDTHIHMYIAFKNQVRYATVHNKLKKIVRRIRGVINYQIPKNDEAVKQYIDKEGNTDEFGDRPKCGSGNREKGYNEAIQLAQNGNVAEALEILTAEQPRDMLIHGNVIQQNLTNLNKTRKRYELPVYNNQNTTLRNWQKKLLELLSTTPKKRRIIWVAGEPESGKTFIHDYLQNLDNFEYGMYDAGQSVSYDNVVYGYDEEGIISWDFPKSYDWDTYGEQAANIIEKFSDFGTRVSSKKYNGSTKFVRGHCLVFSNRMPLMQLLHRDVVFIEAKKEEPRVASIFINKADQEKKLHNINEAIRHSPEDADKVNKAIENKTPDNVVNEANETLETLSPPAMYGMRYDIFNSPDKLSEKRAEALNIRLAYLVENDINPDEQKLIIQRLGKNI